MHTEDDIRKAKECAREARRVAGIIANRISGRMNPQAPSWEEASRLASLTRDLAYHVGWMAAELKPREEPP